MVRSNLARFALLALAAHSVNAAYCASIGDTSQPTWAEAPDWQKESAQKGVEHLLANPELTAADMHTLWVEHKTAEGWKFGPIKDADKKEHPCLVPYDQLPDAQKAKDHLFRGIVLALAGVTEDYVEAPPLPATQQAPASLVTGSVPGFTPIKYVGRRPTYKEGTYGTGIVFEQGQTKMVPADKAKLLLKHPDVYVIGEATGFAPAVPEKAVEGREGYEQPTEDEENARQDAVQSLATMNRANMVKWARINFNQELSAELPAPELRAQIISLIDRFGLVK